MYSCRHDDSKYIRRIQSLCLRRVFFYNYFYCYFFTVIYCIDKTTHNSNLKRKVWKNNKKLSILTIPFEKFVIEPWPYMKEIENYLGTTIGKKTNKVMIKNNVPRKIISDSPALEIYKRCGIEFPSEDSEEISTANQDDSTKSEKDNNNHDLSEKTDKSESL